MAQTQANLDSEINTLLLSGSDITAATLRQVLHDMNAAVFQNGVNGFATPTAQVGLAAVAGSSANAMRSDAAPALSQGIQPVWTSQHTFGSAIPSTNPTTGALTVSSPGGIGCGGSIYIGGTLTCNGTVSGTAVPVEVGQRVTGSVSGTVSTQNYAISVIPGATILGVTAFTTTAFLATGTVTLSAGSGVGDTSYFSGLVIKGAGVATVTSWGGSPTIAGNLSSMPSGSPNFFLQIAQTGTPSGVGSVVIAVRYLVLP